jgi:hypothetical protein
VVWGGGSDKRLKELQIEQKRFEAAIVSKEAEITAIPNSVILTERMREWKARLEYMDEYFTEARARLYRDKDPAEKERMLTTPERRVIFNEIFGSPDHGVWVSKNGKGVRVEVRSLYPTIVFHLA